MNLYLVRHTQTNLGTGICYGRSDVGLRAEWAPDFQKVADRLCHITCRKDIRVFSSPLQRCQQLANFLFPDQPLQLDSRLQEMDFGRWEMQAWNDVPRDQLDCWAVDVAGYTPPGGESYTDLYMRCQSFAQEHLTGESPGDCCIVTHGGVIRGLLAFFLQNAGAAPENSGGLLSALLAESIDFGALCHVQIDFDTREVHYAQSS